MNRKSKKYRQKTVGILYDSLRVIVSMWVCAGVCVCLCHVFVAASHQTRLDTRSKARRPIKVGIKGRGRSGRSRDSNPACLCCSSAHLVQCEPDEASSFTNPNVGPGTYASLRLKLDAWSSAVQRGQKCSSPTRRLPSRSWGPIRPRVCSWFRAPIRHECQTAQLKSRGACPCNLRSSLLRCGTRPIEWGTQWDSNSLLQVC